MTMPAEPGVEPPENEEVVAQPSEADHAWEMRARRMGWAPEAEWRGPREKWKSARDFVEHAENNQPVLIDNLRRMESKFDAMQAKVTELTRTNTEQRRVVEDLYKWSQRADERGYERARAELQQRQRTAVATADTAAHDQATRELEALEEGRQSFQATEGTTPAPRRDAPPAAPAEPATPPADPQRPSPAVEAWVRQNSWWFNADEDMKADAISIYSSMATRNPGRSEDQHLAATLEKVKLMYPDKFSNVRRQDAAAVSEPSAPSSRPGGKKKFGYDDLSRDEKAACDRFVRQIPGYTRDKYVAEWLRNNPQE